MPPTPRSACAARNLNIASASSAVAATGLETTLSYLPSSATSILLRYRDGTNNTPRVPTPGTPLAVSANSAGSGSGSKSAGSSGASGSSVLGTPTPSSSSSHSEEEFRKVVRFHFEDIFIAALLRQGICGAACLGAILALELEEELYLKYLVATQSASETSNAKKELNKKDYREKQISLYRNLKQIHNRVMQ